MNKAAMAIAVAASFAAVGAGAVELVRGDSSWSVANKHYKADFNPAKAGALIRLTYGKTVANVYGTSLSVGYDGQPRKFTGRGHSPPQTVSQLALANTTAEIVEESMERVSMKFSGFLPDGGFASITIACDDSPLIRYDVGLSWKKAVDNVQFSIQSASVKAEDAVFYPESRKFTAVWMNGERSRLPGWKYVSDGRCGFGLLMPDGTDWDMFNSVSRTSSKEARKGWGELCAIQLVRSCHYEASGSLKTSFAVVATKDVKAAFAAAARVLESAPDVQLCDIVPDKVFTKRGGSNGITTTLVNNSSERRMVRVKVELASGLDDVHPVSEETLTLASGEMRVYRKSWTVPKGVAWGVASRVKVYDANTGALLDERSDITNVADRGITASGVGLVNAGWPHKGQSAAWADALRRTYIGATEFYLWAPSTWDPSRKEGLAPQADEWTAFCAEKYGGDNSRLAKKEVKGFVDACHERGIHVYSWTTGLVNYQQALAHPEKFKYCRNGQLQIYSSKVYGQDRYAGAKLAPYTVADAVDWAEQMCDSIDMFGWDGCRWDWGWLPSAPNDPLFLAEMHLDPSAFEWFDWKGRSSTELFPDPDTTGTECLKAWRATVAKRHPGFVYSSNGSAAEDAFRLTPKYANESMRDGLHLVEYLLDIMKKYPTYSAWGKVLAEAAMRIRARGSQTEVGAMRGLNEGTFGADLARATCHASGAKWWCGPSDCRYWGNPHRTLPFAMRFSEYFWGLDFRLVPEAERDMRVSLRDGGRLFWRQFVYERVKDGVRELVVHVVNTKPDAYITVFQPKPKPVVNLVAKATPEKGERLVEAWGLVPGNEPKALRLMPSSDGSVALPRLEETASFVFRFAKRGIER